MTTKSTRSRRGRMENGQPNPIDRHVGSRIKIRRQLLGLSQNRLAAILGLTFQQVQKYEQGQNRVSASRLWDLSKALDVEIGFFFKDMKEETAQSSPKALLTGKASSAASESSDPMQRQETFDLVKAYYKIPNRKAAQQLFDLAIVMSKTQMPSDKSESDEETEKATAPSRERKRKKKQLP